MTIGYLERMSISCLAPKASFFLQLALIMIAATKRAATQFVPVCVPVPMPDFGHAHGHGHGHEKQGWPKA